MAKPSRFVGFLRGINVGGHNKVPMQALRTLLEGEGFDDVATYIQSGNVLFSRAGKTPEALATLLRALVKQHFAVDTPFIVLSAQRYTTLVATQPFGAIAEANEKYVHLGFTQAAVPAAAQATLQAKAKAGERVVVDGGALWVDYGASVAQSKLTPAALDAAAGQPVTMRNVRTLAAVAALL